ncbi:HEAT repeat domain-containing protein [Chloroflexota bacterium]
MEPALPLPIEKIILELTDDSVTPLSSSLAELSNLGTEEMEFFKRSWAGIKPKRRRQIIRRLVELAEDSVELNFDSILKYCLEDQDDEVRSQAIEGLWENEEPSLIKSLIHLLEHDSSEKVQATAAIAMGKFALLAEHNKLRSNHITRIQQALLAAVYDKNKPVEVSRRALEAVAPVSLPEVKTAIMEAYRSLNPRLKVSSVYAMGKSCDVSWLPILLRELTSTDAEVRYEAAGACGDLEEEEAVPYLSKLVNDSDTDVQMAAIHALGKIGSTQARACLKQCLESNSEIVRQMAEQVLGELEAAEDPLSLRL